MPFDPTLVVVETCADPLAGHVRLQRVTALNREDLKKKDKQDGGKKKKDEEEEVDRTTWSKFTRGLRHLVGLN